MTFYSKFNQYKRSQIGVQTELNQQRPQLKSILQGNSKDSYAQYDKKTYKLRSHDKQSYFDEFNNNEFISVSKEYQQKTRYKTRLTQIDHRLKNIMQRHERKKEKIHHLIIEKQNHNHEELMKYKFQPKIKHNPRYPINNNLQQRNKSWDEARAKRFTSIRQEIVEKQVKECTFQPKLMTKQKNRQILQNKLNKIQKQKQKQKNLIENKFIKINNRKLNVDEEIKVVKKDTSNLYNDIKLMIKLEMNKINFLY